MGPKAEKVTAFVTQEAPQGVELLLFEHPHAGIQLPAGTVELGEAHIDSDCFGRRSRRCRRLSPTSAVG